MKKFSLVHRILHWLIAITFCFLVLTILLRLTWMNKDNMAAIITESLSKLDTPISISPEDAVSVAKSIRYSMFQWHINAGYVLVWLYILRMINLAVAGINFPNPFTKGNHFKQKFQAYTYIIFYILLGCSLLTGILMIKGPDAWGELMEEIHVMSLYYVIAFIALHFVGLIIGELTDSKGIVSKMIHGK